MVVRDPLRERVWSVDRDVPGLEPLAAVFLDDVLGHREGREMGEELRDIGDLEVELDLERRVVHRAHAKRVGRHLAVLTACMFLIG